MKHHPLFFKWIKKKYPIALIRVGSDVTVFYRANERKRKIIPFYCCISFDDSGHHSKEFLSKIKELGFDLNKIQLSTSDSFEKMIKSLNIECLLENLTPEQKEREKELLTLIK